MHTHDLSNQEFSNSQGNNEKLNIQSRKNTNVIDDNPAETDFIINEIPPNSTTVTVIKTLPPTPDKYVNPKVSPFDRKFYDITNLEKLWNMPMIHPYKRRPTFKFWFTLFFLVCLILFVVAIGELFSSSPNGSEMKHLK
ncbi:23834_t:CDS:2 [Dentiscutata erythropus]|uniref:23834_t:CDS:1 n=1 Tax=Dentiscutata erythropus TaxID=1348616 RepID=A0A9N9BU45_9GLOM|nr:23834_t:CDS:2 [Dentiscutata erythropus]